MINLWQVLYSAMPAMTCAADRDVQAARTLANRRDRRPTGRVLASHGLVQMRIEPGNVGVALVAAGRDDSVG